MVRKNFIVILISLISIPVFCQISTDLAVTKFYNDFVDVYKEAGKNNSKNIFETIQTSSDYTFSTANPYFLPAVNSVKTTFHLAEKDAVEKLFNLVTAGLRRSRIWESHEKILEDYYPYLKINNDYLCNCWTSSSNKVYNMEELSSRFESCNNKVAADSSFQRSIDSLLNGKSRSSLLPMSNYFTFFCYEKCDVMFDYINRSLLADVNSQYQRELAEFTLGYSENVINLYNKGEFNKLTESFPKYKQFLGILNTIKSFASLKDFRMRPNHLTSMQAAKSKIIVSMPGTGGKVYDYLVTFSSNELNAVVESITKYKVSPAPAGKEETIEEIRELKQ